jgi:hypothetical protein
MCEGAVEIKGAYAVLVHPLTYEFTADLDGNRDKKTGLRYNGAKQWIPYKSSAPVGLSERKLVRKRKWKKRLANMSPEGQAKVWALTRQFLL